MSIYKALEHVVRTAFTFDVEKADRLTERPSWIQWRPSWIQWRPSWIQWLSNTESIMMLSWLP
jgi:hypothetical protein